MNFLVQKKNRLLAAVTNLSPVTRLVAMSCVLYERTLTVATAWPAQRTVMDFHLLAFGTNCFRRVDGASIGWSGWETSHHTDRAIHATVQLGDHIHRLSESKVNTLWLFRIRWRCYLYHVYNQPFRTEHNLLTCIAFWYDHVFITGNIGTSCSGIVNSWSGHAI